MCVCVCVYYKLLNFRIVCVFDFFWSYKKEKKAQRKILGLCVLLKKPAQAKVTEC